MLTPTKRRGFAVAPTTRVIQGEHPKTPGRFATWISISDWYAAGLREVTYHEVVMV